MKLLGFLEHLPARDLAKSEAKEEAKWLLAGQPIAFEAGRNRGSLGTETG